MICSGCSKGQEPAHLQVRFELAKGSPKVGESGDMNDPLDMADIEIAAAEDFLSQGEREAPGSLESSNIGRVPPQGVPEARQGPEYRRR